MGVSMDPPAFVSSVQGLLCEVQSALLSAATAFREENIVDVSSYEELKAAVAEGERGGGAREGGGVESRFRSAFWRREQGVRQLGLPFVEG